MKKNREALTEAIKSKEYYKRGLEWYLHKYLSVYVGRFYWVLLFASVLLAFRFTFRFDWKNVLGLNNLPNILTPINKTRIIPKSGFSFAIRPMEMLKTVHLKN